MPSSGIFDLARFVHQAFLYKGERVLDPVIEMFLITTEHSA